MGAPSIDPKSPAKMYMAKLTPLGTDSNYTISYGGFLQDTPANCIGCGVHIHTGRSCKDDLAQQGHYFVDPVLADPWNSDTVYKSDKNGDSDYSGMVKMGTNDVDGHAFVVHNADGGRIACGLIKEVSIFNAPSIDPKSPAKMYMAKLTPLGTDSKVLGSLFVFTPEGEGTDANYTISYGGFLQDTPANCIGCGVHIHTGRSCKDDLAQQGHYFVDPVLADPWNSDTVYK